MTIILHVFIFRKGGTLGVHVHRYDLAGLQDQVQSPVDGEEEEVEQLVFGGVGHLVEHVEQLVAGAVIVVSHQKRELTGEQLMRTIGRKRGAKTAAEPRLRFRFRFRLRPQPVIRLSAHHQIPHGFRATLLTSHHEDLTADTGPNTSIRVVAQF